MNVLDKIFTVCTLSARARLRPRAGHEGVDSSTTDFIVPTKFVDFSADFIGYVCRRFHSSDAVFGWGRFLADFIVPMQLSLFLVWAGLVG